MGAFAEGSECVVLLGQGEASQGDVCLTNVFVEYDFILIHVYSQ